MLYTQTATDYTCLFSPASIISIYVFKSLFLLYKWTKKISSQFMIKFHCLRILFNRDRFFSPFLCYTRESPSVSSLSFLDKMLHQSNQVSLALTFLQNDAEIFPISRPTNQLRFFDICLLALAAVILFLIFHLFSESSYKSGKTLKIIENSYAQYSSKTKIQAHIQCLNSVTVFLPAV